MQYQFFLKKWLHAAPARASYPIEIWLDEDVLEEMAADSPGITLEESLEELANWLLPQLSQQMGHPAARNRQSDGLFRFQRRIKRMKRNYILTDRIRDPQ